MYICPSCYSDHIKFNTRENKYCCIDCWDTFEQPLEKTQGVHLFFSYGHDKNKPLVEKIKVYLTNRGHTVWIDESEIKAGDNWRRKIAEGVRASDSVLAFLSKHSVRIPGVCRDELRIALCVQHAQIQTILTEKESEVSPPASLCDIQWLDMSNWEEMQQSGENSFNEWFQKKMDELCACIESKKTIAFNGEIETLKKKLSPVLSHSKEYRLAAKPMFGREWLIKELDDWRNSRDTERVFLITGTAGSGKSTFAANCAHYNSHVYSSIFFEWNISESYSTYNFIRTLAFKLAVRLPDYRSELLQLITNDNIDSFSEEMLMEYLITAPLSMCVDGCRDTVLVLIDGLDEIGPGGEKILRILSSTISKLPLWIKFVLTSRPNEVLHSIFGKVKHICLSNDMLGEISKYIYEQLEGIADEEKCKKLAQCCEGSFLYAESLCESIKLGDLQINDTSKIPCGISGFYYLNFERSFSCMDYSLWRPILELLAVYGSIPRVLLKNMLGLDEYSFAERMHPLKNLVITSYPNTNDRDTSDQDKAIISFQHKSIGEWLCNYTQAGKYFVDIQNGKKRLLEYGLDMIYRTMNNVESRSEDICYGYLYARIPHLLVDSRRFEDYEKLLLDKEAERERLWDTTKYGDPYYRSYEAYDFSLWCRLGDFPSNYDVTRIHEAFHNSFALFRKLLSRAVYQSTIIYGSIFQMFKGQLHQEFMRNELCYVLENIILPAYLRSAASDEYPYSGLPYIFNADKLRAANQLNLLVDECKANGYFFDDNKMQIIEEFRLSVFFCEGSTDLETAYLNFPSLFIGRINTLDVTKATNFPRDIDRVKIEFNSYVLFNHLIDDPIKKPAFIEQLLQHGARYEIVEQLIKIFKYRMNARQLQAVEEYFKNKG